MGLETGGTTAGAVVGGGSSLDAETTPTTTTTTRASAAAPSCCIVTAFPIKVRVTSGFVPSSGATLGSSADVVPAPVNENLEQQSNPHRILSIV